MRLAPLRVGLGCVVLLVVGCRESGPPANPGARASGLASAASGPTVVSFNIRDFPRDPSQARRAFETLAALRPQVIGVQEIGDPEAFGTGLRATLGPSWRAVFSEDGAPRPDRRPHLLGVAWDAGRYRLDRSRSHDEVRVRRGLRPALEVRLRPVGEGPGLRVFVVHLKAGGDAEASKLRAEQLRRLRPILREAVAGPDALVLLGDFNATGEADRAELAGFARDTGLVWASEDLACTAFWRPDGHCRGSALDHVFTRGRPRAVRAEGPCREGCAPGRRCPAFWAEVSDHCPLRLEL